MGINLLRFNDLVECGIVNNRPQLRRLQEEHGFPVGRMLSPNTRTWTETEIAEWYATRPANASTQIRGAAKRKHAEKQAKKLAALTDHVARRARLTTNDAVVG